MQDPRIPLSENPLSIKPKKKKNPTPKASLLQVQGNVVIGEGNPPLPLKSRPKVSKRPIMTEVSPSFQKPEGSNSDSLPDSSAGGSEYRQLRRKYLQLEDDGFALGKELKEAEDQVKTLEEEKIALLDQHFNLQHFFTLFFIFLHHHYYPILILFSTTPTTTMETLSATRTTSSSLNPNAPMFVPLAYRTVEDFSDDWWALVHSSPWFRDYWLRERFQDPQNQTDAFSEFDFDMDEDDLFHVHQIEHQHEDGKELVSLGSLKWRGYGGWAEAPKYAEKAPKNFKPRVSPRAIHQPR